MIFKIDHNYEFFIVLDKNTSAHRPIIIDSSCIMIFVFIIRVNSYWIKPLFFAIIKFADLVIIPE